MRLLLGNQPSAVAVGHRPGLEFWYRRFALQPGQEWREYLNEVHPEPCGFNFRPTGSALWADGGECGHLHNASGIEGSMRRS